jgi:predicted RNase H-like nuclease
MSASFDHRNGPSARIIGIDLAWGERNPDGLCLIAASPERGVILRTALTSGDAELLGWLAQQVAPEENALLVIDAPLIVPNAAGSRPVDKQITSRFGRHHAGCYPANAAKCVRPLRVARLLKERGYAIGFDFSLHPRLAAEVYPHPAMIRLFELDFIIKYKKGAVAAKRLEFRRLQALIKKLLPTRFAHLELAPPVRALLKQPWTKSAEDQTDALFCALIGYHHWLHQGQRSEIVGETESGFILLPAPLLDS